MSVCHCRDLGKVRDAQNLMAASDDSHFFGYLLSRPSTDSCINLIKDQCFNLISVCKNRFYRQHDPGQLTAGNDPSQRLHTLAGICGDFIFNAVIAVICKLLLSLKVNPEFYIKKVQIPQTFNNLFC